MFWLPKGWVPGYVEWMLAFPRAPTGSISILVWEMACAYVIQMVATALASGIMLGMGSQMAGKKKGEPMKVGAQNREGKKET